MGMVFALIFFFREKLEFRSYDFGEGGLFFFGSRWVRVNFVYVG